MISILLIDHSTESERSVRELLAASDASNFKVHRVVSYREILKGFRSKSYDVCIIDSGFGNGLRLFTQARGIGCVAPILLVTENDATEVLEAMRNGVADCLVRYELDTSRIERAVCYVVEQAQEASLQFARERRYLALLDNASATIYTHDLEGKLTSINRAGERLIGYSQQEILGLHVSELLEPEDRPRVCRMIAQTLDAQVEIMEKVVFRTKQGGKVRMAVSVHPIYKEGQATEVQGIITSLPVMPLSEVRGARAFFGNGSLRQAENKNSSFSSTFRQQRLAEREHNQALA